MLYSYHKELEELDLGRLVQIYRLKKLKYPKKDREKESLIFSILFWTLMVQTIIISIQSLNKIILN